MKKKSLTLFVLLSSGLVLMAQTYVAPPPLLPNPAYSNHPAPNQAVYTPGNNNSNAIIQTPEVKTHLVKKGESLYRISKMYNVTIDDIKLWNHLQSDVIAAGSSLNIGTFAPAPINSNAINSPSSYNQLTERAVFGWLRGNPSHTVLAGESLASIANYYGLSEARLRWMNNLGAQDHAPAGYVLNVDPCLSSKGTPPPASYEQSNTTNNFSANTGQDFSSPVPRYTPQNRYPDQVNPPNSYNYSGNTGSVYRREDQYESNSANSSAVPNSYEYSARTVVPNTNKPENNFSYGGMIYENGKRVHVVGTNDTLETIADQYQVSAERLRALNKMGAYDVVWPNQKLILE